MSLPFAIRYVLAVPVILASLAATPGPVQGQVMVYPARGQSAEQTQRDKGECLGWATSQTGFDPTAPRSTAPPPSTYNDQDPGRPVLRGAARGAVVGTVGGAIAGDAGKGAAIGAAGGALIGGVRHRDRQREASQQQQNYQNQQNAQFDQQQSNFNRAYAVCLEGRGYTVR